MIKYPVRVEPHTIQKGRQDFLIISSEENSEILAMAYREDVANTLVNALNAMHEFPYVGCDIANIEEWEKTHFPERYSDKEIK
jgi:hypothetical protein